jgi:hypothetical protein
MVVSNPISHCRRVDKVVNKKYQSFMSGQDQPAVERKGG